MLWQGADSPLVFNPHQTVSAQLLDFDGSPVAGDPLENAFGIVFYDEWDGPGNGQCTLSLSEAGSAELLPGRYVNCKVNGIARFTFMIEGNPEYRVIQRGEEHDQIITVRGRGWAALLDAAIVYPEYSLQTSLETTWRLFSFASILFPNAGGWGAAVEQAEYLDGVVEFDCYGHAQLAPDGNPYPAPIGWPWGTNPFNLVDGAPTGNYVNQYWLRTDNQPDYADPGYLFFRNTFTLTETTPVTFTVTGDNFFTMFLQGVPILGEAMTNADHWMWQGWKQHQIWLPAGEYTVGAVVYNIAFSTLGGDPVYYPPCSAEGWAGGYRDGNPAGLLFAAYIDGDATTAPAHILTSDDSWIGYYELDTWPGWTPGQILLRLLAESIARGGLGIYNPTAPWDADDDSNGDAWRPYDVTVNRSDIPTFAVEVGTTIMQALVQMQEMGWIHWHVRPGSMVLDVFRARLPIAPTSMATFAHGVNIGALERNATAPYANALMVQWEGGYVVVEDTAAIAAMGGTRIEDLYQSDAASDAEATIQGENELVVRAQGAFPSVVLVVEPTSEADCPYVAFETGDYVTVPAEGGGTEDVRCLSIRCQQDELGYAIWALELNAKLDVPSRRTDQLLQQIGGRNQVIRGAVA